MRGPNHRCSAMASRTLDNARPYRRARGEATAQRGGRKPSGASQCAAEPNSRAAALEKGRPPSSKPVPSLRPIQLLGARRSSSRPQPRGRPDRRWPHHSGILHPLEMAGNSGFANRFFSQRRGQSEGLAWRPHRYGNIWKADPSLITHHPGRRARFRKRSGRREKPTPRCPGHSALIAIPSPMSANPYASPDFQVADLPSRQASSAPRSLPSRCPSSSS